MEGFVRFVLLVIISFCAVLIAKGENELVRKNRNNVMKNESDSDQSCDMYKGSWVYDSMYPLYEAKDCPFIQHQFDCQVNGRPDSYYLKFRWSPSRCSLPRFDGVEFLRRIRGKRMMFVGDSISLNQWQSLACMLHRATPHTKYTDTRTGALSQFSFPAYNTSLMFLRDGFLLKIANEKIGRVLDLNMVSQGQSWEGIDILIFNTWHWWLHTGRKQPWDFIEDGNKMHKDMDRLVAYEKGLRTWARWVDLHLKDTKIKVFFQGISPDHMNTLNWEDHNLTSSCVRETRPEYRQSTYGGGQHPAEMVVERVIREMSRPVHLLRITRLSQMRRDGHPGVYGIGRHRLPDCSHWCLPGVPDTWNHLLYASLLQKQV